MNCPKCDSSLRIGKTFITFEGDTSPDTPTRAFQNMPMICVNPECKSYGSADLDNPKFVVETVKNQIN